MKRLAIFVSGSGTNMHRIANYFSNHPQIEISLVVCNNPNAGAIARAKSLGIPLLMINRKSFKNPKTLIDELYKKQIDWIILAGFLWLIPKALIQAYPNKIVNIHPALLPDYGGKGMYGEKVHQAVINNGEKKSGITIHFVNEHYDAGAVIFQQQLELHADETPESLARRIHELEYKHFPEVIAQLVLKADN
ncbi:MAG: phosphoribosylglycinamide formyltransferase [Bacteroidales bacterium]|jgi:phosphoribosylglycinamide formyltransferase-1|nr:phosphoribosylglycinamide formyltransferase [Bacteroidales bacterium]MDN5350873.1 phosphoribosylglycinamide formyltransferase 1 [Bacteroidales bacterium]